MADDTNSTAPENTFPIFEGLDFGAALGALASAEAAAPAGRSLTTGEIRMAESVFGDAIDYDQVKIFEGDYFPENDSGRIGVFDGEIFAPSSMYLDDYSLGEGVERSRFLHEMTHVWQDQTGVDIPAAIRDIRGENAGDYEAGYDYDLEPGKAFEDYNIEAQAEIVSDYLFFRDTNFAPPGNRDATLDDYRETLPFTPIEDEAPADLGISNEQPTVAAPAAPVVPDTGPGEDAPSLAGEDAPLPQPEAPPSQPSSQPTPTARPLTPEDIENDPELAEDLRFLQEQDTQGGDNTANPGSPPEEEDDQENAGGGSETPNPIDDPIPGNGDVTVLTNRNVNAINTGPGGFELADFDGDFSDLLDRNAPAINTGSGDFDMPVVTGDLSDLLDRNAPAINTGFRDFDMPSVGGDLSDLLDRNGGRQTADAELASPTIGDDLLSGFEFGSTLDDFAAFDIA